MKITKQRLKEIIKEELEAEPRISVARQYVQQHPEDAASQHGFVHVSSKQHKPPRNKCAE